MSVPENTTHEHKLQLRLEALDKELKRMKDSSLKQSGKVSNLRLSLYFQMVFFITLFIVLFLQGFISMPSGNSAADVIARVDTVFIEQPVQEDSIQPIIYNTHKSAIPKDDYNGVLFAIQIGAYKDLDLSEYKDNLLGLKQDTYDSLNQFTLGEFIEYEEALAFLSKVQQMGFEQAHIMSFKKGQRIRLEYALSMLEKEEVISTNVVADKKFLEANDERFAILAQ